MTSQPLFILSPPRSFTSVTCAMIGNHPQLLGLPETNLFARDTIGELQELYRFRPRFQHGLLRTIAELALGGQTEQNIEAAQEWLAENASLSTAEAFRDLMALAEPRGLIDKSPLYVVTDGALERIISNFPEARFLHLVRHPRGTCESIYKLRQSTMRGRNWMQQLGRGGAQTLIANQIEVELTPTRMWLRPHQRVLNLLSNVDSEHKMCLQGELLLSNPRPHLIDIAKWLGVSTEESAIESMLHPETSPFACFGPSNATFGNDPSFLKDPTLRPYSPKPMTLDGPLSWDDSLTFSEELRNQAIELGYQ